MIAALIYKEWKKTKWFYLGLQLLGLLLLTYIFISINRSFRIVGASHIWDVIVNKNVMLFSLTKYFATTVGVCLGIAQFAPELLQKRIKLTLHLPMSETKIMTTMFIYGQLLILSFLAIHIVAIVIFSSYYFPSEILQSTLLTIIPWYISGFVAYSFMALICLEPTWKRRILYLFLFLPSLYINFISTSPGVYQKALWIVFVIMIIVAPLAFISVDRFKKGIQD